MEKAFTLLELIIVVAIIGILAAIALPNFMNAQVRAKLAHSYSEMRTYRMIQKMYLMDHNDIPGHYDGDREHCPYILLGYIGAPLTDPFTIDDPNVKDTSHQGMYHSTHLRDPFAILQINPQLYNDWVRESQGYVIFGEGPGIPTWDYYDVSNGLLSNGMILSIGSKGKGTPMSNLAGRKCF